MKNVSFTMIRFWKMIYDQANAGQAKGRLINGYVLKIMGMLKDEKIKKASIPGS